MVGYVSEMERAYSIPKYNQVHGCFPNQPFIALLSERLASDGIVHSPEHDESITQLRE